jgi:CubicO group peptidase (beta-lactamase class C family)
MAEAFSREEMVKNIAAEPLLFEPGARWSYSNSGYYLLGLVIEKVTGQTYAEVVRDLAIAPSGLTKTGYCPQTPTGPGEAQGQRLHLAHGDLSCR